MTRTFRVWAPRARSLALRIRGDDIAMSDPDYQGWHEVEADAEPGDNYVYVVNGDELPDPWTRWQPDGLRGPYRIGLPRSGRWKELINTDAGQYGGGNVGNMGSVEAEPIPWHGQAFSAEVTLPPLAGLWLVPEGV